MFHINTMAIKRNAISASHGSRNGRGAYWASSPESKEPATRPNMFATVVKSAARLRSPWGSRSASVAAPAAPKTPTAIPCRVRPTRKPEIPGRTRKASEPRSAEASASSKTGRRPMLSERFPPEAARRGCRRRKAKKSSSARRPKNRFYPDRVDKAASEEHSP